MLLLYDIIQQQYLLNLKKIKNKSQVVVKAQI